MKRAWSRGSAILGALACAPAVSLTMACGAVGGTGPTTLAITNKISSLGAGKTYVFDIAEDHDGGTGFTLHLTGAGTLVPTGTSATYVAPSVPPQPNSVTVTATAANGTGASDFDTFTITAAAGAVISISPSTFTVTAGGPAVELDISVAQDDPMATFFAGVSGSPDCSGPCGSLSAISGTPGGGAYTVEYTPPASVTEETQQRVEVLFSNRPNSTSGVAFVTIKP
jgi:hypothetical protein